MKKIAFVFLPFLLAAFVIPDDSCSRKPIPPGTGKQIDGPYVSYLKGDKVMIRYVVQDSTGNVSIKLDSTTLAERISYPLTVLTDDSSRKFTVNLKPTLENEKAEFGQPAKMFIVSDIEGNFAAFRKILQGNQVIDSNFNWTFGNGHLVLTGDFVDRGEQQTEVLWLIYSLEEKAKAQGGYVHFILGNHEIMNMGGDLRYVNGKYLFYAGLMGESFTNLYGAQSEIGRWLRTKNVMEKIGDILFCHGGVSAPVNRMNFGTPKINKTVRTYYGDSTAQYSSTEADLFYSDLGPFWYRGYYHGIKATPAQIDSTLNFYHVKHIATGHTVIADTISLLYNGKVINTDVHHAKGHIEAILYEDGNFYRVKPTGEKFPFLITRKETNPVGWNQNVRDNFFKSRVVSAVDGGMDKSAADKYCDCMSKKMEEQYPSVADLIKLT